MEDAVEQNFSLSRHFSSLSSSSATKYSSLDRVHVLVCPFGDILLIHCLLSQGELGSPAHSLFNIDVISSPTPHLPVCVGVEKPWAANLHSY